MLEREAAEQGISAAQLIRDAAILRVAAIAARRGDSELLTSIEELAERGLRRRSSQQPNGDTRDPERLAAVRAAGLLDAAGDPDFDRLADLARRMVNAPVALVTLIEADRQVFVSAPGLKEPWASRGETPLAYSFCREAVVCRESFVVNDARLDPAVKDSPAIEEMDVVAYLGAPLITSDGHALGALCVIDAVPRLWTSDQVDMIKTLAAAAVSRIELRVASK